MMKIICQSAALLDSKRIFYNLKILVPALSLSLLLILSFISFYNAKSDFSYDYRHYIKYAEEVSLLSFNEIISTINGPYFELRNSTGGIELGFVFILKVFTLFSSDPKVVYALIGTFSLFLKVRILSLLNVSTSWIIFICLYSAVLLESNALRSGLSLSFFLYFLYCYFKKNTIVALFFAILAIATHFQSLYFITLLYAYTRCSKFSFFQRRWGMNFLALCSLFVGLFGSVLINQFSLGKLAVYASNESQSGGLNLVSGISLISLLVIMFSFIINGPLRSRTSLLFKEEYYFGCIVICSSALSFYIFLTEIAVVGDRLWQWAFVVLVASYNGFYKRKINSAGNILLASCMLISLINIIFRYPLSNFFYPFISYQRLSF
ncbi:EpsG family protein [Aliikangiella sp. IMCC44632]